MTYLYIIQALVFLYLSIRWASNITLDIVIKMIFIVLCGINVVLTLQSFQALGYAFKLVSG